MDINSILSISGAGLDLQKMRLDVIAMNLANASTSRAEDGSIYKPLSVVAQARNNPDISSSDFASLLDIRVVEKENPIKKVYDPSNPKAGADGYVDMPNVNPIDEMTELMVATRMYEANVQVVNAAKLMTAKALEI